MLHLETCLLIAEADRVLCHLMMLLTVFFLVFPWTKTDIIYFQKKSLLKAFSTMKHSLSTIRINYSGKMKISLCELLIGTQSVRLARNTLNSIIVHNLFVQCLQI